MHERVLAIDYVQAATAAAIARAKAIGASEVSADDLLLGCLRVVSRFGVVVAGATVIDLELLGVDWLAEPKEGQAKVSYSQGVVDVLDRAALIAKRDNSAKMGIEHLLAAFAASECGIMSALRREYGVTSATWRAAAGTFGRVEVTKPALESARETAPAREYLSPEEAAIELGIHVQTLCAYVRAGKLPAQRLAGERAIRIRREDLHLLMEPFQPEG